MRNLFTMHQIRTMDTTPLTTPPNDPARLAALDDLVQAAKDFLRCDMGDPLLRLESGELALALENYRRQRHRQPQLAPAARRKPRDLSLAH